VAPVASTTAPIALIKDVRIRIGCLPAVRVDMGFAPKRSN
jgi:hypothetical protein